MVAAMLADDCVLPLDIHLSSILKNCVARRVQFDAVVRHNILQSLHYFMKGLLFLELELKVLVYSMNSEIVLSLLKL